MPVFSPRRPADGTDAPWGLAGTAVVALVNGGRDGALPAGLARVPGPVVVGAALYQSSPVGSYAELGVAEPARHGWQLGLSVTTMAVDSSESALHGRRLWGFPKQLGSLRWHEDPGPSLRWEERGVHVWAQPLGAGIPMVAPLRSLQARDGQPVLVPGWLRGVLRPAAVHLEAPPGDALSALAGRHPGMVVGRLLLVLGPPRPLHAPGAGILGPSSRPRQARKQ